MRYFFQLWTGALISGTLLSFALLSCSSGQSGNETEPSMSETSIAAETPPSTQAPPSEAVTSPTSRERPGPLPEPPNPDRDVALRNGDLKAAIVEWRGGGLQPEVTSIRVRNDGTNEVDGFAIAIRSFDANGKRLKTSYYEVRRHEGIAGRTERVFPVHVPLSADADSVEAEAVDLIADQAQENLRMLQEEAHKEGSSRKP
jgi:hypothetical protein